MRPHKVSHFGRLGVGKVYMVYIDAALPVCRSQPQMSQSRAKFITLVSAGMVQETAFESGTEGFGSLRLCCSNCAFL